MKHLDAAALFAKVSQCHRLIDEIDDKQTKRALEELAGIYERQAFELQGTVANAPKIH